MWTKQGMHQEKPILQKAKWCGFSARSLAFDTSLKFNYKAWILLNSIIKETLFQSFFGGIDSLGLLRKRDHYANYGTAAPNKWHTWGFENLFLSMCSTSPDYFDGGPHKVLSKSVMLYRLERVKQFSIFILHLPDSFPYLWFSGWQKLREFLKNYLWRC